jgi:alpha-mannosidase
MVLKFLRISRQRKKKFPPKIILRSDTYNAQTTIKETLFHVKNYKEKERSNESMMVFGHGDGGGGPLMSM